MFRRVVVPAMLVLAVPLAEALYLVAWTGYYRSSIDRLVAGRGDMQSLWLPPAVPMGWLLFVPVFLAVHMCVLRGGNRRDCLAVTILPVLIMGIAYAAIGVRTAGSSWPLLALGFTHPVLTRTVSAGTAIAVHEYAGNWLGICATALSALWLYFFVARRPVSLPVPVEEGQQQTGQA